jgi:hypothetical protein
MVESIGDATGTVRVTLRLLLLLLLETKTTKETKETKTTKETKEGRKALHRAPRSSLLLLCVLLCCVFAHVLSSWS